MEIREGPRDHKNSTQATGDYQVTLADLEPSRGITDSLDDVLFGLCDTSFAETFDSGLTDTGPGRQAVGTNCLSRFCNHLRLTTNADTVYLCDRQSLQIATTTSVEFADDTEEMHRALTSAISNLDHCNDAFQLPDVRVFPDYSRLTFTVIPLRPQLGVPAPPDARVTGYLAIIVDADEEYQQTNPCLAAAVQAIFNTFTSDSSAPDNRQLQRSVFDQLKHEYHICSDRITSKRREIFYQDLQHVTVHFEKLLALDSNSAESTAPMVWGWHAVASQLEDDKYPQALYQQAELWGESFTTELDTHILRTAAFRYKEACEAANINAFDSIKPLCVTVYARSILQDSYTEVLQQLTEMAVVRGEKLLLELSEQTSVCASTETAAALRDYKKVLQSCRDRFGVQIGLCEFGTGHSSLLRMNTLKPDAIRPAALLLPDRELPADEWVDAALQLSVIADTKPANATSDKSAPLQILVDGSQLPATSDLQQGIFDQLDANSSAAKSTKSLAA